MSESVWLVIVKKGDYDNKIFRSEENAYKYAFEILYNFTVKEINAYFTYLDNKKIPNTKLVKVSAYLDKIVNKKILWEDKYKKFFRDNFQLRCESAGLTLYQVCDVKNLIIE